MAGDDSLEARLRAGYAAWNESRELSDVIAWIDPAVELIMSERGPEGALAFRGHEGIAEWVRGMGDVWREITFEPVEVRLDEPHRRALAIVRVTTTGRSSDVGLEATEGHVYDLGPDGRVVRIQAFDDVERARAAFEAV
jgi:hypothetical protein